jgi:hypothetical protein
MPVNINLLLISYTVIAVAYVFLNFEHLNFAGNVGTTKLSMKKHRIIMFLLNFLFFSSFSMFLLSILQNPFN